MASQDYLSQFSITIPPCSCVKEDRERESQSERDKIDEEMSEREGGG